jgi:hypothetical protein
MLKIAAGICAALLVAACAVDEREEQPATTSVEQSLLWACTGADTWTRYWKVNGVEKGREYCNCDGSITQYGTLTGTYSQVAGSTCGGGGGGGGGGGCTGGCCFRASLRSDALAPLYPPPGC